MITFIFIISIFSSAFGQVTPNPERFKYDLFGNNLTINLFELWDNKNSFPKNSVLFVGSSSIRYWYTSNYFPELPIINRGFGGSHISDINYFINETVLKYKPQIIVFYAGDNDISNGKSAQNVLDNYITFTNLVNKILPKTEIIFISIKPSIKRWYLWNIMKKANQLIRTYSNEKPYLYYLDIATPMFKGDGFPNDLLFESDSLHLNNKGYDLWVRELKPLLNDLYENYQ